MSSSKRARSLFAQQRMKATKSAPIEGIDSEVIYAVEQCVAGAYAGSARQVVPIGFMEQLRDAAFCLNVDFATQVAPFFNSLEEFDRCIFTWRGASKCWAVLMFDGVRRAELALVGVPGMQKLVGTFTYSICPERTALRLHDVGPYAEVLAEPDGSDVVLRVPDTGATIKLINQTPEHLRIAPAAPSYFDASE